MKTILKYIICILVILNLFIVKGLACTALIGYDNPSNGFFQFEATSSYGAAPFTYHWDFGDGTQDSGVSVEKQYESSGSFEVFFTLTDNDGCVSNASFVVQSHVTQDDCDVLDCVYPGDTNGDNQANIYDLFPISIYHGVNGPSRGETSMDWEGQICENWKIDDIYGINLKHSDCNGDGVIDQNDIEAINLNYQNDHSFEGSYGDENDPPLYLELVTDSIIVDLLNPVNVEVSFNVYLGNETNQITDLYGIASSLEFDEELIVPGSVEFYYEQNSFLCNSENLLEVKKEFNGHYDFALARNNGLSSSGFGKIAVVNFTIIADLVVQRTGSDTQMPFYVNVTGTSGIRDNGSTISINNKDLNFMIHLDRTSPNRNLIDDSTISIAPNPSNGMLHIESTEHPIDLVKIMSAQGALIQQYDAGRSMNYNADLSHLPNGVYFINIQSDDRFITKKIVLFK